MTSNECPYGRQVQTASPVAADVKTLLVLLQSANQRQYTDALSPIDSPVAAELAY